MDWDVEGTEEFETWYAALGPTQQDRVEYVIEKLKGEGPLLGRPHADTLRDSRYPNMKRLRVQAAGDELRIFFAFDPRRIAVLLAGGDKKADHHFYERMIPIADARYAAHLKEIGELRQ